MTASRVCDVEGCGKPSKSRGWCNTHYERWRKNGGPNAFAPRASMLERFADKYVVSGNGCWIWTGAKDASGYGHFGVAAGVSKKAHRVSHQMYVGHVPDGLYVCHTCDVPSCVNPAHLFLGTHQANMADRGKKKRTAHGEANGKSVITKEIAAYIRGSKLSERALAKELGIHRGTVNAVKSGRTWKEVEL